MSGSVWYVGVANVRAISAAAWANVGITGADERIWSEANGWSIPQSAFTQPQLDYLDSQVDFEVTPQDGDRPGPLDPGYRPPDETPATRAWVLEQLGSGGVTFPDMIDLGSPYDTTGA